MSNFDEKRMKIAIKQMLLKNAPPRSVVLKISLNVFIDEVKREKEFYEQQRLEDQKKIEDEEIQNANSGESFVCLSFRSFANDEACYYIF